MRRSISFCCALTALLAAGAGARAALPDTLLHSATGALAVLERLQIQPDPATLDQTMALAILTAADPGARVLSAADWRHLEDERAGRDFTLGVRLSMSNGLPTVLGVASNSPAARSGLQPGDLLTSVNDQDLSDVGISRAALLLRGHTNLSLRIGFRRGGAATNEITAVLEPGAVPAVETADLLGGDLAYLRLNGLFAGTADEVLPYLTNWQARGRFGLVLDLRGADGRDAESALAVAGRFEQSDRLLARWEDTRGKELAVRKAPAGAPLAMPLLVLVDGETTGAAELLAATLAGSVRGALLVGDPTSGDPLLREALPLDEQRFAWVATRRLVTADRTVFDGRQGVQPDVTLARDGGGGPEFEPNAALDRRHTVREELEDRALRSRLQGDAVLRRAVDILLGLKALNIRAFRADAADQD